MIARFTEPAADCRFSTKVAVPFVGATEFCALDRVDEARRANADCHFPPQALVDGRALGLSEPGQTIHKLPTAARHAPCAPTGANEASMGAEAATRAPGATWANVVRDVANDADPPGVDPPFFPRSPAVPTPVSHQGSDREMDASESTRNPSAPDPEIQPHEYGRDERPTPTATTAFAPESLEPLSPPAPTPTPASAGQLAHGAEDVLVARRGVDGRGVDALVPSEALHESDVSRGPVGVGQGRVPQGMERERPVETGALLPEAEEEAQRPGSDAPSAPRDEERSAGVEALAAVALPSGQTCRACTRRRRAGRPPGSRARHSSA